MKKVLKWTFLVFIVLCAFFSLTQVRENTITGNMENLTAGDKVYVASYHASKKAWVVDDSTIVEKDGEFAISTTDKNEIIHLHFVKTGDSLDVTKSYANLYLENLGKYTVTGDAALPSLDKIIGGVYNYPEMMEIDSLKDRMDDIYEKYRNIRKSDSPDTASMRALMEEYNDIEEKCNGLYKIVITNYPDDTHSAYFLKNSYIITPENISEVDSLYNTLGENAIKSSYARDVKKNIDNLSSSLVGGKAADFALTDITTGDTLRLSDKRGSITLVEFWASWCPPCRASNPHLVELYKKYHPAGLEVIGVATSDKEENWKKAIEDDGLLWHQVNSSEEVKGQDNIAKRYGVAYIPTSIIVDKEGKIIYRGEPDGVEEMLKSLFPDVK